MPVELERRGRGDFLYLRRLFVAGVALILIEELLELAPTGLS
jgi:hypothetical protein